MLFKDYPAKDWPDVLPDIPDEARELVSQLVQYESGHRLTAKEVCPKS